MRTFALYVGIPATVMLILIAFVDLAKGRLWRAVVIGAVGGLLASIAYDLYRLP